MSVEPAGLDLKQFAAQTADFLQLSLHGRVDTTDFLCGVIVKQECSVVFSRLPTAPAVLVEGQLHSRELTSVDAAAGSPVTLISGWPRLNPPEGRLRTL